MKHIRLKYCCLIVFLLAGCSGLATPSYPTATPAPTYTPYPIPSPIPTYTPYPTPTVMQPTIGGFSLISMNYIIDNWNPRIIDLRTAGTSGIDIHPGDSLRLFDLWITSPDGLTGSVRAEIYVNGQQFGATPLQILKSGVMQLEPIENPNDPGSDWTLNIQDGWDSVEIKLNLYSNTSLIGTQTTEISLEGASSGTGTAWLNAAPYTHVSSIIYTVNDGPDIVMSLPYALANGIQVSSGDQLNIKEIWYRTNNNGPAKDISIKAYLSSGLPDSGRTIESLQNPLKPSWGQFVFDTPFSWTIEEGKVFISLTIYKDNYYVLENFNIPFVYMDEFCVGASLPFSLLDGLLAHYKFDGNLRDSSENNVQAEGVSIAPAANRFDISNAAISLNGRDSEIDTTIELPNGEYSISIWYYAFNLGNINTGIISTYAGSAIYDGIYYSVAGASEYLFTDGNRREDSNLDVGQWTHIVIVKNETGVFVYKNGVKSIEALDATTSHRRLLLIGNSLYEGKYFNGLVDDARIYNRALDADEISALYNECGWNGN